MGLETTHPEHLARKRLLVREIEGLLGYAEMYGLRPVSLEALELLEEIARKEVQTEGFPETHWTANDWAARTFRVEITETPEKVRSLVETLVASDTPRFSFLVVQAKGGKETLWCSPAAHRYLLRFWKGDANSLSSNGSEETLGS